MATLPGRIRRISLDAGNPINYGIFGTFDYDINRPAASQDYWAPEAYQLTAMDQALSIAAPAGTEVPNQGAFIYFERFPFLFSGVIAKIRPTYDFIQNGEDPYLEMWTHDGVTLLWTLQRRVQLINPFSGVPSGKLKYFDFRLDVPLDNVSEVWVTMDPGSVGAPTNSFMALHVFGRCMNDPIINGSCENDPTVECLPPGCEDDLEACTTPVVDCISNPDACKIPPFDDPKGPPPPADIDPPGPPPDLPPGPDLCDPVAVDAYKLTLTEEQLAFFNDLLANNEFVCLVPPDKTPEDQVPINPGPVPKRLPKQPTEDEPDDPNDPKKQGPIVSSNPVWTDYNFHFFFWPNSETRAGFIDHVKDAVTHPEYSFPELASVRAAWNHDNVDEPVTELYPHTNLENGVQFDVTGISYHDQVLVTSYQRQPTYDGGGLVVYPLRFIPAAANNAGAVDALFNATIGINFIWRWILESDAPLSAFGATVRDIPLGINYAEMLLTNAHSASFRAMWNGCSATVGLNEFAVAVYQNDGPVCPMTDEVPDPTFIENFRNQFYFRITVRRLNNNFSVSSSVPGPAVTASII